MNSLVLGVKRETCAFVRRKIRGRSKRVGLIGDGVIALLALVNTARLGMPALTAQIPDGERLIKLKERLRRMGMELAAQDIERGDFQSFLRRTTVSASASGEVSAQLRELSLELKSRTSAATAELLSRAASTRARQIGAAQKVRSLIASRYYTQGGVELSSLIESEGVKLAREADQA